MKKNIFFIIAVSFISDTVFAQITYPDSCLSIGFYYKKANNKLDTVKTIALKKSAVANFFYSNDTLLNLVVAFKNGCNQKIAIPSSLRLDMPGQDALSIEGVQIKENKTDTLLFLMEYDYFHSKYSEYILQAKKVRFIRYYYSLGFKCSEKGTFKFRLKFLNEFNHIPFDQWKYYYSNWIYLTIK